MENLIGNNAYLYQVYSDMKEHLEKHGIDLRKRTNLCG